MKVTYYTTASGRSPVQDYIAELPADRAEDVLAAIRDIEAHGIEDASVKAGTSMESSGS